MPDRAPSREEFAGFRPVTVRWGDVDIYGHVNNAAYHSYVDSAVNEWLILDVGEDLRAGGDIGVVAETRCRFLGEIDFPAEVEVGLAVARLGNSSVTYRFGVFVAGQDEARAVGTFVHVYVDRATRRPSAVPGSVRRALSSLSSSPGLPRGQE